jgi:hypothetical protein
MQPGTCAFIGKEVSEIVLCTYTQNIFLITNFLTLPEKILYLQALILYFYLLFVKLAFSSLKFVNIYTLHENIYYLEVLIIERGTGGISVSLKEDIAITKSLPYRKKVILQLKIRNYFREIAKSALLSTALPKTLVSFDRFTSKNFSILLLKKSVKTKRVLKIRVFFLVYRFYSCAF